MSWINKHKNIWRIVILVLVPIAIMGPWYLDRINVPAEYTCSAPHIRLYGDFCGMPLSGIWPFRFIIDGIVYLSAELVTGAIGFIEWVQIFLLGLFLFLLVLPAFNTLLLILRREHRHWQVFNIVAWGLALGIGLSIGITDYPKPFGVLWGIWLYIGVAIGALVLEGLTLKTQKNRDQICPG